MCVVGCRAWLALYAEIYFRAWQKSGNEVTVRIEEEVIQNLMNHAIHARRDGTPNMASALFTVRSIFTFNSFNAGRLVMLNGGKKTPYT
jgi:hypothetical protein